ncbi:MAG: hypothetical protein ABSE73_14425 [Planctomycetota bacterium]
MSQISKQQPAKTAAHHIEAIESLVYARLHSIYRPDIKCLQQGGRGALTGGAAATLGQAGAIHAGSRCSFCNGTGFNGPFACVHCNGTGHVQQVA